MPGKHSAKQKRQAKHVADSERARGVDPKRAESIGWATVNKQARKGEATEYSMGAGLRVAADTPGYKPKQPAPTPPKESPKPAPPKAPATTTVSAKPSVAAVAQANATPTAALRTMKSNKDKKLDKAAEAALPRPKTEWATERENMSRMDYNARIKKTPNKKPGTAAPHQQNFLERRRQGIKDLGTVTLTAKKAFQVLSINDYHSLVSKADQPAPAIGPAKKFPRTDKKTVKMKPVSDAEAMANLKTGANRKEGPITNNYDKALLKQLAVLKALATGYGKTSGGGALKSPNRLMLTLQRAMETMPLPSGKSPPVYLPGVHSPNHPMRKKKQPRLPGQSKAPAAAKAVADEPENVVHKSVGDQPMAKMNFADLFKSDAEQPADEVLCDCPHCEAPITKSDLAKAHKGKGAVTNISGPKSVKADAHVSKQNNDGGTSRAGDGKGQVAPSRPGSGIPKQDPPAGVQNSKGSKARKAFDDSSSCDASSSGGDDSDDKDKKDDKAPPFAKKDAKKSITVRGTEWVQYVEDGSDEAIAKSILEGATNPHNPTQPLDRNNDLTRLLI